MYAVCCCLQLMQHRSAEKQKTGEFKFTFSNQIKCLLGQCYRFIATSNRNTREILKRTSSLVIIVLLREVHSYLSLFLFVQVVLSGSLSGSQFEWTVDGATIMSEEFYKDRGLSQTIVLRVSNLNCFRVLFLGGRTDDLGCEIKFCYVAFKVSVP